MQRLTSSLLKMSRRANCLPYRAFTTTEKTFMADQMIIEHMDPKDLKPKPDKDHVYAFGALSTDYRLEIDYDYSNGGW